MLRIGLIGLDNSHAVAFARLLNDPADPHYVRGARIVAGWPGGSPDFDLSISRVPTFTQQLRDDFGVRIVETPEDAAADADLVFITSADGRNHRELFTRVASAGKPIFIDKPIATTLDDATWILREAESRGIPLMSSSSLRFSDNLVRAIASLGDQPVHGIDLYGPLELQPSQPGVFWYGVHTVEVAVRVLGPHCREARSIISPRHELIALAWDNDRAATIHGLRNSHSAFGATLHTPAGPLTADLKNNLRPYYASLLEAILTHLPAGRSPVPPTETLAVVAILEAINRSRETSQPATIARVD